MKKLFLPLFCLLFLSAGLFAQAPSGFKFQAVARDADNDVMATDNIAVRVSLLRGGPSGPVDYSEHHEVTTTDLGVFDLHIGNGTSLSGDMTTIDWGADNYFLKIDIDPNGGTSYVNLGASQLLSVPYAMYANTAGNGGGGNPTDELQNLIYDPVTQTLTLTDGNSVTLQVGGGGGGTDDQTISLSGTTLSIEGGNAVDLSVLQDGVDDADADPTNEIQNLSFNVATNELSIAGGNTVAIPSGGTDADADPTNEIQAITKAGNTVTLSEGGGSFTDEVDDADADPTNEIQTITKAGSTVTLSDGGGSFTDDVDDADADPTNELQTLSLSGNSLTLSNGGGNVTLPGGGSTTLDLPYFDQVSEPSGGAFHVHNISTNASYGLVGSTGSSTLPANRAGVLGYSTNAHGVYGVSDNSFFAGVQGVSNSAEGVGVQGYGFGGGVGGHFYTTSSGVAALTTGRGNVGIGIDEPEMKMHVGGDLFVQTNLGELVMGFPDNGNQWQFSTRGQGADLQFQSKADGINSFTTRFRMRQNGEFQIGDLGTPTAWMHIAKNSTISKPQLKLEEIGNDYARLELTNSVAGGAFWHVAGLPSTTASAAKLNFYFRNASGAGDRMTITGDGEVGINGTPTARLELFQRSQSVGTGLRFDDGTANADWDVTHGFALRFHYGGSLRGFINANTGAYTQSSDETLKTNVAVIGTVMDKVRQLRPTTYEYKSSQEKETTVGFLAQEVLPIFPELVSYSKADKLYGVNYAGFSVIALKAVQEQQQVIEQQEEKINNLEARLARLEALLIKGQRD